VLDDNTPQGHGTNIYLYGNGRIAQTNGPDTEYFLGDALGSVRQLTDASGAVTLAKNYDPFGNAVSSLGSTTTPYGFTGEQQDSYIKLINLRSRLYSPVAGRFLTRDSWQGDYSRPLSLNRWNYVEGNPINREDPTGHWVYSRFTDGKINKWEDEEKDLVDQMAGKVANAYADTINSDVLYRLWNPCMGLSFPAFWEIFKVTPTQAFYMIHYGRILFEKSDDVASMGKTENQHWIKFYQYALKNGPTTGHFFFMSGYRRVITHEIGHAFDNAVEYYSGLLSF
jgi:RHS repeat-associated protein